MIQRHYDRRTSAVRAMALIGNGGMVDPGRGRNPRKTLPPSSTTEELVCILRAMTPETMEADRLRALRLLGVEE